MLGGRYIQVLSYEYPYPFRKTFIFSLLWAASKWFCYDVLLHCFTNIGILHNHCICTCVCRVSYGNNANVAFIIFRSCSGLIIHVLKSCDRSAFWQEPRQNCCRDARKIVKRFKESTLRSYGFRAAIFDFTMTSLATTIDAMGEDILVQFVKTTAAKY